MRAAGGAQTGRALAGQAAGSGAALRWPGGAGVGSPGSVKCAAGGRWWFGKRPVVVVSGTVRSVMSAKRGLGAGLRTGVRVRHQLSAAGALRRGAGASVLGALLLAAGACSAGAAGSGGQAGSCAWEITIAGVTYIAGRGSEGAAPVPHSGTELHGTTPPCNDTPGSGSTVPAQPAIAYAIPGVLVADAVAGPGSNVAGPGSNEVMVADRLWQSPWAELPPELQPYVRR
jgi:hypothetical protein